MLHLGPRGIAGRLTVICNAGKSKSGHTLLLCRCDCGQSKIVFQSNLGRGNTKSCGCYEKDFPSDYKHGMRHSIEYQTWANMIQRCTNKNRPDYERYGGRGIKVCDEWKNSFESFYKDMGNKPKGKTLDRIDNEGKE